MEKWKGGKMDKLLEYVSSLRSLRFALCAFRSAKN